MVMLRLNNPVLGIAAIQCPVASIGVASVCSNQKPAQQGLAIGLGHQARNRIGRVCFLEDAAADPRNVVAMQLHNASWDTKFLVQGFDPMNELNGQTRLAVTRGTQIDAPRQQGQLRFTRRKRPIQDLW